MKFKIGSKSVGDDCPVLIVAELSANHGRDFNLAVKLIKTAKKIGVDAIKLQTYSADTMTLDIDTKYFRIKHPKWGGQTLYQLYKKACTPWLWFKKLKRIADDLGIIFFSTAFDKSAVDFLEEIDVPMHKIASFELVDLPLIEYAAKTKKPLILSTGMATLTEIREAVSVARCSGTEEIILLKCTSCYPARPEEMNLKTIPDMKKRFGFPVGISDHTLGIGVSLAAVSLGVVMVEKHITLSRKLKTPDNFFSLEPDEFKKLVENIRVAEKALGRVYYGFTEEEKKSRIFRRSLFVIKDIKRGEVFTEENTKSIRPANGLRPKYLKEILGKRAKEDIKKGAPLDWNMVK